MADFDGGPGDDTFDGTNADEVINGNGGNDSLAGGGGADTINGGDGNDVLFSQNRSTNAISTDFGTEVDTLNGGTGDDQVYAGYGDNVDGGTVGAYGDRLFITFQGATSGVNADFRLLQSQGSITIGGGVITHIENIGYLEGSNYDDLLVPIDTYYPSSASVYGRGGNDHIIADYYSGIYSSSGLYGGDGDDVIDAMPSGYGAKAYGEAGDDTIYNGNGFGASFGGDGNDTINGAVTAHGGAGDDVINAGFSYYGPIYYGDAGNDTLNGSSIGDIMAGGSGADKLYGNDGNDTLYSAVADDATSIDAFSSLDTGVEHDQLYGGAGDDTIYAGYGDTVDGGTGTNTLILTLTGSPSALTVDGNAILAGTASFGGGTITNIQRIARIDGTNFSDVIIMPTQPIAAEAHGGTGNDTITAGTSTVTLYGDAGNDTLTGSTVADTLYGGDGDDTLDGGTGGDAMYGGIGNDTYIVDDPGDHVYENAGEGTDTIRSSISFGLTDAPNVEKLILTGTANINGTGSSGDDTITGNSGNNVLAGGNGNDTLDGGAGLDSLYGQGGDDTIVVSAAGDIAPGETFDGGAGNDTLSIRANNVDLSNAVITSVETLDSSSYTVSMTAAQFNGFQTLRVGDINLLTGGTITVTSGYMPSVPNVTTIRLANVDTVVDATSYAPSINTTYGVNITGGAGNDTITGSAFGDTITGGAGLDIIHGGAGFDTFNVSAADVVAGELYDGGADGARIQFGGPTIVDITGVTLTSVTDAKAGQVKLTAAQLAAFTGGFEGVSFTLADGGAVTVNAVMNPLLTTTFNLAAVDTVFTVARNQPGTLNGAMLVNGNIGNDTINGTGLADRLYGNDGNDTLHGGGGRDDLYGGAGNDILDGGSGADNMYGGVGDDTYYVDNNSDHIGENAGEGYDTEYSSINFILADNVERGILTASAFAYGNSGDNWLIGSSAADYLYGEDGNDRLDGGGGADHLLGGLGNDTYVYDPLDTIVENAGEGIDTIESGVSIDLGGFANIENVTLTGTADVDATGNALANVLTGNSGANHLNDSGAGDTLIGGAGDDIYLITDSSTVVVEAAGGGNDTIKTYVNYTLAAGVEVETMRAVGTANVFLTGNSAHQILIGNASTNLLDDGGFGAFDRMKGGGGNDVYAVHNTGDVIIEVDGEGYDQVLTYTNYTLGAGQSIERLAVYDWGTNFAIDLGGNDHSQSLEGNNGVNHITGGSGNERILGYGGNDVLVGGAGSDTFVFGHGTGQDSVGDFTSGTDKLDLSAFGFANFAAVQAATHDVGGNAVIDLGGGDTVTLNGFLSAQLQSGDVILSGGGQIPLSAKASTQVDDTIKDNADVVHAGMLHAWVNEAAFAVL